MKIIAVIPARYNASRFPGKLMEKLGDHTVITTTYKATLATGLFDDVFVATDSALIYDEIQKHQGKVIISTRIHESGSDRIAEAVTDIDADIVVNVQGDEPFVDQAVLSELIAVFKNDTAQEIDLVSLMRPISDWDIIENPNHVKVITDQMGFALYFSRSVIPYPRDKSVGAQYFQHIGVYAFRKNALMDFSALPMKSLEATEKLEQLRYLEFGKKIKMVITHHVSIGIDTPEDLILAKKHLQNIKN
jgi:3-deoxy-manno-octulosonate cytidylyltransferase (CMP-KDO synthetase)